MFTLFKGSKSRERLTIRPRQLQRRRAPRTEFLFLLALTLDAQDGGRPRFQPLGIDLLSTAIADPITAGVDLPERALDGAGFVRKLIDAGQV
jgi:hypothetical protein